MNSAIAQRGKTWPSCLDYKLKGKVKSWTMKNDSAVVRRQEFNIKGELIKDTYKGTVQTYVPPEHMPEKMRTNLEKVYRDKSGSTGDTKLVFNSRMQLTEKKGPVYHEVNRFTKDGKILTHNLTEITRQTRAWNSTHHPEPTYSFTDTVKVVAVFKYNKDGFIKQFDYYHSDPFKNIRMVYLYDGSNNLIEAQRYDNYNIHVSFMPDNYLDKFTNQDIDAEFSIDKYYPEYWSQGSPSKQSWKYNSKGKRIEYIAHGKAGPSFKATWEYDDKGRLIKEIHHDVYHNSTRCIVEFDAQANVIKETDFDYWAKKSNNFYYDLVYY